MWQSLARAECDICWVILGVFVTNLGRFCGRRVVLWSRNALLSSKTITWDHLIKIERLNARVTAVRSPARVEMWFILDDVGHFFASSSRCCGLGASLWTWNPLLSRKNISQQYLKYDTYFGGSTRFGHAINTITQSFDWFGSCLIVKSYSTVLVHQILSLLKALTLF